MTTSLADQGLIRVTMNQVGRTVFTDGQETILDIAQRNGVDYPCGCESGVCGACKSVLLTGEVNLLPHSSQALTRAEADRGLILACRAIPKGHVDVAWLDADDPAPNHRRDTQLLRVSALRKMTHDIVRVRLELSQTFSFTPGQSVNLKIGQLPSRPYSMASQPRDDYLEFHIRKTPGGLVSSFIFDELTIGEEVKIDGPFGASFLREDHTGPIIAIAGGSGLAPVMSLVEAALLRFPERRVVMLVGARDECDIYYEQRLRQLQLQHSSFDLAFVLSQPGQSVEPGRLTGNLADVLKDMLLPVEGAKAYLAGPPIMVETCIVALVALGLVQSNCHADAFVNSSA